MQTGDGAATKGALVSLGLVCFANQVAFSAHPKTGLRENVQTNKAAKFAPNVRRNFQSFCRGQVQIGIAHNV